VTSSVAFAAGIFLLLPVATLEAQGIEATDFIEWTSGAGAVSFPHRLHFEDLEIECADCHHETNAARLDMPHPEYLEDFWIDCGGCHQANSAAATPQACSNCHHDSPVTVADETLSSKVVIHRSCWGCHDVATGMEASKGCPGCHRESSN